MLEVFVSIGLGVLIAVAVTAFMAAVGMALEAARRWVWRW